MSSPTVQDLLETLKSKAAEKTRLTYARHGMPYELTLGVSVADMKLIAKTIRGRQDLALALYKTGFMEPMYLAGMVADGALMSREQLEAWAEGAAELPMISEYTVPWVTVENADAREIAAAWIASDRPHMVSSGWCAYSGILATQSDDRLDLPEIEGLLQRVVDEVANADNRVKSKMNSFVIAVGTYVGPLSAAAKAAAEKMGEVSVDVGDTACKIPIAAAAIAKAEAGGKLGLKKRTIRC